jgi:hypothetical protein
MAVARGDSRQRADDHDTPEALRRDDSGAGEAEDQNQIDAGADAEEAAPDVMGGARRASGTGEMVKLATN